jgi:hypothetical protein
MQLPTKGVSTLLWWWGLRDCDLESYAGGSTGMTTHARKVKRRPRLTQRCSAKKKKELMQLNEIG